LIILKRKKKRKRRKKKTKKKEIKKRGGTNTKMKSGSDIVTGDSLEKKTRKGRTDDGIEKGKKLNLLYIYISFFLSTPTCSYSHG
jgi:hypothetical protein